MSGSLATSNTSNYASGHMPAAAAASPSSSSQPTAAAAGVAAGAGERIKERISTAQEKLFILLNDALADNPSECLDYSLRQEQDRALQLGQRVAKCMARCECAYQAHTESSSMHAPYILALASTCVCPPPPPPTHPPCGCAEIHLNALKFERTVSATSHMSPSLTPSPTHTHQTRYYALKSSFSAAGRSLLLARSLRVRLWDDSGVTVRQLPSVGRLLGARLAAAGLGSLRTLAACGNSHRIEVAAQR